MEELFYARERYGTTFATALPDGQIVPWKLLSIEDYFEYDGLFALNKYPVSLLEDEIFEKCVLDPVLVNNIHKLKAGTVSTVVTNIMALSGPGTIEDWRLSIDIARNSINSALHHLVSIICQAFPAYTPDDVYKMDYQTFTQRLALAEYKLLSAGLIPSPIELYNPKEEPVPEKPVPKKSTRGQNLKKVFDQQRVPSKQQQQTIITKQDTLEHQAVAYTGHEKEDKMILEQKMVDNTAGIYDEYIKQMNQGNQVKIMSPEERKVAALRRAEENRKENIKQLENKKKEAQAIEEAYQRKIQRAARKKVKKR